MLTIIHMRARDYATPYYHYYHNIILYNKHSLHAGYFGSN